MLKPCLDCGTLSTKTRCPTHAVARRKLKYDNATYRAAAAQVRANGQPCWICGEGDKPGDPWQADHVTRTTLRRAHRTCNATRGTQVTIF